jgi:hypothetical protein
MKRLQGNFLLSQFMVGRRDECCGVPFRRLFSFSPPKGTHVMIQKLSISAALGMALFFCSSSAQAQFGGVQVQVGGYGSGVRIGNFGYGNGSYNGYGYGNRGYGYGNGFASPYYSNYGSRYGAYNNGFRYNSNPSYGYGYAAPRYYAAPIRTYPMRRYRYR